jgi:hypothetical protein
LQHTSFDYKVPILTCAFSLRRIFAAFTSLTKISIQIPFYFLRTKKEEEKYRTDGQYFVNEDREELLMYETQRI